MPTQVEFEQTKLERQYVEGRLHFAIAGTAGSGKSSLIKCRSYGCRRNDHSIGRYDDPHPDRSKFVCSNYFVKQGLYSFDAIIVLFDSRFVDTNITIFENYEMREELDEDESEDEEDVRSKDREARRTRVDADAKTQYISQTRRNVRENLRKVGLDARGVELRD
ncbi:hypothetical protein D9757_010522 [Collybiopsis confluens]|uniref:Uncharacterized protein n=1 Tax=Collybiopsis confluens TaxID=2823264 RepID=A0A8H5GP68_9AGAR|nr:hypothetical protein D9757_010522 [Collybiopsis confluens]